MRKSEYLKLVNQLNNYCYQYEILSESEVSDEEYDKLYLELKNIEKNYPDLIVDYSPTQRIGSPISSKLPTQRREIKMMSLDNAFTEEDFRSFSEKLFEEQYAVELKLDGCGLELIYIFGRLTLALSRGNGSEGEVVTHAARAIKSIPLYIQELEEVERIEIRGEVILPYAAAEEYKKNHPEKLTISPRNIASGSMRLLDPKQVAERKLVFIPHSLGYFPEGLITSFKDFNQKCKSWRFRTISTQLCSSNVGVTNLYKRFVGYRAKLPFAADGLVIKVNEFSRHNIYGEGVKFPNWAIAWKFPAEEKETILREIIPQVGRTGVISPVAVFDAVELSGAMVTKATLHNYEEIKRKDIRIGDTILVSRSGDVIPKVLSVVTEKRTYYSKEIQLPTNCPDCNSELVKDKTYINCRNYKCRGKVIARLIHFSSRNAMNIQGFGDSISEYLYNTYQIDTLSKLMNLGIVEDSLTYKNLADSVEKSKHNLEPHRFLFGLGIYGVGEVQAEQIVNYLHSKSKSLHTLLVDQLTADSLIELEGIGETTLRNIKTFLSKDSLAQDALAAYDSIKSWRMPKQASSDKFSGKTFVITGALTKPRKQVEDYIKDNQGKVSSSVSKKTDFLVCGDNPGNDKYQAAQKHNTTIISEVELYNL